MQEHIRRAHPEHYIPKLPATEESFLLMINSPPSEHRADQLLLQLRRVPMTDEITTAMALATPVPLATVMNIRRAAVAQCLGLQMPQAALAELHGVKSERDVEVDGYYSDSDGRRIPRTSIELPPLHLSNNDVTSDPYTSNGPNRPRKQSITKRGRESNHKKKSSRGSAADWIRRFQNEDRFRPANDRKALSAEPSADFGKRWEDLIDAADQAASAAGDLDEDRTPVPAVSSINSSSVLATILSPNFNLGATKHPHCRQALTPPSYNQDSIDPFPSVESGESGENFHIGSRGLNDSSPTYSSQNTQIYCAACQNASLL
ncbi:hypothetical protein J3459_004049 [Metarhizium acridum]|nr:hypothetical protein J3459_004049 [Metarhizium acridum]